MATERKFVFSGGGTGGHIFPNIAISQKLKQLYPQAEIHYFGSSSTEASIVTKLPEKINYYQIRTCGFPVILKSPASIKAGLILFLGIFQAYLKLKRIRPDLVISSGGYVAAPVIFASRLLRIPVFIHEQNVVFGRLNRITSKFAARIGVTFADSLEHLPPGKGFYSGYPVRENFQKKFDLEKIKNELKIPLHNRIIFFVGGSMGAKTINQAVVEIANELLQKPDLTIIISTGKAFRQEYRAYEETIAALNRKKIDGEIKGRLIIREFFNNIEEIMAISDLIVARAGAGTINEILALKKLALLIPKSDLPGDHQILNAMQMKKNGLAEILLEDVDFTSRQFNFYIQPHKLLTRIEALLQETEETKRIRHNLAAQSIPDCTTIFSAEIKSFLESKKEPLQKEVRVFFLKEETSERISELLFDLNSFGQSALNDFIIPDAGKRTIFQIKLTNGNGQESLLLIPRCREILLNNTLLKKPAVIKEKDQIAYRNYCWTIDSYTEKINQISENRSLQRSVLASSLGIIISRLGGFFREIVTAAVFGAGKIMDIFSVGLNISNFMRRVVAENALENAFIPIFMRLFQRSSHKKTWQVAAHITNFSLLLAATFTLFGIVFTPAIIKLLFPGFVQKGILNEAVAMTRLLFPYLFLITAASVLTTYLKIFNQYRKAEASAIFFSIGSILGILLLKNVAGGYALAIGVLLGGFFQIIYLITPVKRELSAPELEFHYEPKIQLKDRTTKKYLASLAPISLDVTISQIGTIADKFFASYMATGSLSYLYYAMHIFLLPFAFISQAIGNVIVREFSNNIALFNRQKARQLFLNGIVLNLFLLTPISVLMIVLARPIVSLLLERFNFTASAVTSTALALQYYSLGLIGWGLHNLSNRIFAARMELKISLYINTLLLGTHITLCYFLVKTPLAFAAIALATSISYSTFALIRLIVLKNRLQRDEIDLKLSDLLPPLYKTLIATLFMLLAIAEAKFILNFIEIRSLFLANLLQLSTISFIGLSAYLLSSLLLRNDALYLIKKQKNEKKNGKFHPTALSANKFLEYAQSDPQNARQFSYKVNIYLRSSSWQIRNIAIKLIAVLHAEEYIPLLISILNRGEKNHFLRRNALQALQSFNLWNDELRELLKKLLKDNYYEVRSAALKFLLINMPAEEYTIFAERIEKIVKGGNLEEKLAAFQLISRKGRASELKLIYPFLMAENSLLREAILEMLFFYYRRKIINKEEIKEFLSTVQIVSSNFTISFRLKELYNAILKEIGI